MAKTEREEMLDVVSKKGAVIYKGVVYTSANISELPSEADMAAGDEEKTAAAKESIQSQIDALQEQLKKLDAAPKAAPKAAKEESKSEAKSEAKVEAKK